MTHAPKLEWPQGSPLFEVQWRTVASSLAGDGVVSPTDLEVTATANALEIEIASGEVFYQDAKYTFSGPKTITLSSGDGTYDRWDTVYFDVGTTDALVYEGTPAADPEPPDLSAADELLLAVVYVPQNATDVPDSDVLNWRATFSNEAGEVFYDDSPGTYGVNTVDAALDELQEASQITAYPLDLDVDTDMDVSGTDLTDSALGSPVLYESANGWFRNEVVQALSNLTGDETFSDYPFVSSDIETDAVTATELAQAVDLETMRSRDNIITSVLASLGTNPTAFGSLVDAVIDSNSAAGTAHSYSLDLDGTPLLRPEVESDGAGGIQNPRLDVPAPLALLAQSAAPGFAGQGAGFYDTDGETPKYADSAGAYQRPLARVDVEQFDKDETGTVNAGNIGIIWFTNIADQSTIEIYQAGLLLDTLEPAPSGLDLTIFTGDNAGNATTRQVVITGDGSVKDDQTGDPLASWQNTTGAAITVALGVDNGNFNTGTGSSQDIAATFAGQIV
jgi:hypothetical protein